ncbi:flagellar hook capping FlgD N-terminal domain-containing protein, partial [Cribrihabitans sp. XS_ASV171]
LEPLDSSQYAAQLAQFSMVEQQVQTNDMLTALVSQLGGASMADLAGWIGMEARSHAPAQYSGEAITVMPQVVEDADRAVMVIRDSSGEEVERREIPLDGAPVDWSGSEGLAHGLYSFSTESYRADEMLADLAMPSYRRIAEARFENGMVLLQLAGGGVIRAEDVIGLREGG